jgi:uncharacterized protein YjiS (DUF1127 family)
MSMTSHAVERGTVFDGEAAAGGIGVKRLTARIFAFVTGAGRRAAHRRARREMLAMPDHLLKDIGLTRAEIRFSVEHDRFGRTDGL